MYFFNKVLSVTEMVEISQHSLDKLASDLDSGRITDSEYIDLKNAFEVVMAVYDCCRAAGMIGAGWRYENRDYQWLVLVDKDGSCYESLISTNPRKILRAFAEVVYREL